MTIYDNRDNGYASIAELMVGDLFEYDGDYFDLHKPSDIRSLIITIGYVTDENEQLKQQKQQYKGQRDYLLVVSERTCSKELFEETKSYLKEVE